MMGKMDSQILGDSSVNIDDSQSNGLKQEVAELFELINVHFENVNQTHRNHDEEKAEKRSYWSFIGVSIVFAVIWLIAKFTPIDFWLRFQNPMVIIHSLTVLLYLSAGIYFIVQLREAKHFFGYIKEPTTDSLNSLGKTLQQELVLFEQLDTYSVNSISYVSERFKYQYEAIGIFKSYLIGGIEKVGLVPGFIATLAAIFGVLYVESWWILSALYLAIGATIGVYMAMVPMLFASLNIKKYGFLLEQYLKMRGNGQ